MDSSPGCAMGDRIIVSKLFSKDDFKLERKKGSTASIIYGSRHGYLTGGLGLLSVLMSCSHAY